MRRVNLSLLLLLSPTARKFQCDGAIRRGLAALLLAGLGCGPQSLPVLPDAGFAAADGSTDAGATDAGGLVQDGGVRDGGGLDAGPRDGGLRCVGPPRLELEPVEPLVFATPSTQALTVRNTGCEPVEAVDLEVTDTEGSAMAPVLERFGIEGCPTNPCRVDARICGAEDPDCADPAATLDITYTNPDPAPVQDIVRLRIVTADARAGATAQLVGLNASCTLPTPKLRLETFEPRIGAPVALNGDDSRPGTGPTGTSTIVDYRWRMVFAPPPVSSFSMQGQATTSFTPAKDGVFFIGLDVTNACGVTSVTPGLLMFPVLP